MLMGMPKSGIFFLSSAGTASNSRAHSDADKMKSHTQFVALVTSSARA